MTHSYSELAEDPDYNFHSEGESMYEPFQSEATQQDSELQYTRGAGCCRILNFAYPWLHLRRHIKNELNLGDFPLPQTSENCQRRANNIVERLRSKGPSIRRLLVYEFRWELFVCCLLVLMDFMVKLANSLLMGQIIRMLTSSTEEIHEQANQQQPSAQISDNLVVGIFFVLLFIGIYLKLWVFHYCTELGAKLRFTLTHIIYTKTMRLSSADLHDYGLGRLMNLVSNDLNDLDNGMVWVVQLFMLPISLSVATYALWRSFAEYSIVGLMVLVLSLKLQDAINKTVKEPIKEKNKISDRRIFYCKELVKHIKTVKMYVWEQELLQIISELRRKETEFNFNIMLSQGISKMLSYVSVMLSVLSMVLTKVIFQPSLLQRDQIYASIGVFGVIRGTNFNGGLNYFTSISIILERVDSFLQVEDIRKRSTERIVYTTKVSPEVELESIVLSAKLKVNQKREHRSSDIVYIFRKDNDSMRKIGKLNLSEQRRIFVYGSSGAGKTSFVEAFLNESHHYHVENLKGSLAYVPQEPVLFAGTIRDNITFGRPYEEDRFNEVVSACCLTKDIERFPDGIDSKVTMQGSSYSGGQRARVALARALYSDSDIILFDNCLSALDPKVRMKVHENLLSETFATRCFIFSTSSEDEVPRDCFFIHISEQKIKYFGQYKEGALVANHRHHELLEERSEQSAVDNNQLARLEEVVIEDQSGEVSRETILYYLGHTGTGKKGYFKLAVILGLFVFCELAVLSFYKQLPQLGEHTWLKLKTIGNYLTMYLCLDYLRMYVMVVLACTNSLDSHDKFIRKIAYAQYGWFGKKQPELVNVFANHVGIIDRPLPSVVYDVVKGLLSNFIYILSLCIVTPAFIPIALILILMFWLVKHLLREYIQKSKMFELKYRSPVYNQLAQVFAGSTVVRAFNCEKQFATRFRQMVFNSERTFFAFVKMNRFFDIVLEMIVFLMIVIGITFTILFTQTDHKSTLALSVFTLINMTSELSYNIRQTLTAELNFLSLEKVLSYKDTPTEDLTPPEHEEAGPSQIPLGGELVFKNVRMKYPGSNNYSLNDLNMTIKDGQKVALMGRTGAGKSSVFLALYRLFETEPESVITIGGMNIRDIDLYTLRKRYLSCSAQDPVKLLPLTNDCSPSQLKYQSIIASSETPVKCLDEPFANIDSSLEGDLWKHISRMRTVMAVVHSGDLKRWDRLLIMQDGHLARELVKQKQESEQYP